MPLVKATAASGGTATITIPATGQSSTVLRKIWYSYSTSGAIGPLRITVGSSNIVFDIDVRGNNALTPSDATGDMTVPAGIDVTITLVGVTGAIPKLVVQYDVSKVKP